MPSELQSFDSERRENRKHDKRRNPSPQLRKQLAEFYGNRCVHCDHFSQLHHLNDNPMDSNRFENLVPVCEEVNRKALGARQGKLVLQDQVFLELELQIKQILAQVGNVHTYAKAYGCHRMLAYFHGQFGERASELEAFGECLKDLDRVGGMVERRTQVKCLLIHDVVLLGTELWLRHLPKDQGADPKASFLVRLANIVEDCGVETLCVKAAWEKATALREKAALLSRRARELNKDLRSEAEKGIIREDTFNLRREGQSLVLRGSGNGWIKLEQALERFDNPQETEGKGNTLFSMALAELRAGRPTKAMDWLKMMPPWEKQNRWNAAGAQTLKGNLLVKDGKVKSGKNELEEAMERYVSCSLPLPLIAMEDVEQWINPALNLGLTRDSASILGLGLSTPLPYQVLKRIEWFLGELRNEI